MPTNPSMLAEIRARTNRLLADNSRDDRPSLRTLAKRVEEAFDLIAKFDVEADAIRSNVMIPAEGRKKKLQDATIQKLKAIQNLENMMADEQRMLRNERIYRERLPAAPTDPVSIQIRAELRSWLRALDSQARYKAVAVDQLAQNPTLLQAIMEGPSQLSGVPQQLVDSLRSQLVAAKGGPAFDHVDQEIASLTRVALHLARGAAQDASELDAATFAARVSSVRSESVAAVDMSDADLPTLLGAAAAAAKADAV